MKWRNSKERELLSSGGSRESTLPNKGNPNPDLSDVVKGEEEEEEEEKYESDCEDILHDGHQEELLKDSPQSSPLGSPVAMEIHQDHNHVTSDSEDEEISVS